jgi:hypothetical protein
MGDKFYKYNPATDIFIPPAYPSRAEAYYDLPAMARAVVAKGLASEGGVFVTHVPDVGWAVAYRKH